MSERFKDKRLKPCPFCGGEAEICPSAFRGFSVRCSVCPVLYARVPMFATKEEAIEAWNRRPNNE